MPNIYGDPGTGMQVTVIGGEVALGTHEGSDFQPISSTNPLPTVSSPGTATPTSLISKISRFIGWAMFNATPTTRTEGQAGPLQADANGNLLNSFGTRLAGENITKDVQYTRYRGSGVYISTATTTQAKTGSGHLGRVLFTGGTMGTVTIYDNTAASGRIIASFDSTMPLGSHTINQEFFIGCCVVTSAAQKVTVIFDN